MLNLRSIILTSLALLLLFSTPWAVGQGATQYQYDPNGRLVAVITPNGTAVYQYDAAGNLVSIRQLGVSAFSLSSFSPQTGTIGDKVTFTGVGLDSVTSVSFNGAPAQILSASTAALVTQVPAGAVTGPVTLSGPRGALVTPSPFNVVAGVRIAPSFIAILPGEGVTFQATVQGIPDQRVSWFVNGIAGGNGNIGVISAAGAYMPPNLNAGLTVAITAASQANPTVVGQATLEMLGPQAAVQAQASPLSVSFGVSAFIAPAAKPVSVSHNQGFDAIPLASAVSVSFGESALIAPIARPVSVNRNPGFDATSQATAVSVSFAAPVITQVSPLLLMRGGSEILSITGADLSGVTAVNFIDAGGALDGAITVTNVTVSADGSSLTGAVTTASGAAPGQDVIYVVSPNGQSLPVSTGLNGITVQ